ncbi:hypothetical protein O3M35_004988 [Rhynocoris fuscipes]|uniref:Acyltransferase C-terminal domain-containing protein n=1 Tax=Rhynocoris fuscipes TaxID=488301 RepID=A0AAW1DNS8_9HEMI
MGDSLETCRYGSCLILVNHQSTADVPLMMSVIQGQKTIKRYMWIMDWFLRYTSFGLVSHFHRDFFIEVLIDEDRKLKWIIDITVAYEDGIPLDIFSYILHWNDPCTTYIFYRVYEAAEVPEDENGMITWLYNLWETKENILNLFYSKIMPLKFNAYHKNKLGDLLQPTKLKPDFLKIILINIFHITAIYLNYRFVCYIISYIF